MAYNNADIELIASLNESSSEAEILKAIKILNSRLQTNANAKIKLQADFDTKAVEQEIQRLQALLQAKSANNINIKGNVNTKGIVSSVRNAMYQANKVASQNKISVNFDIKKEKLINDIKILGQQNTKLFTDSNMTAKYNSLLDNAKLATSNNELKNLRLQLSAMRSELKATNMSGLTFGDTLKKTFKRATELFSGTGGVMLLSQQLREAWTESLNLDKAFTDLIKVQDELSRSDYPDYLDMCNKKAQDLATTQQGLIEGATEFSRSGYNQTTSNKLSEKSTILSNVGDMNAADSAKAIISGVQAYDQVDGLTDVVDKAQALIDKYNEIGNTASITTAEIAQGVQRVGSVFADANTSVDEFIALLAAGNRQFQDADSLSLGLRTAALRIRGCKVELEQMGEETDNVYTSASELQKKIADLTNIDGSGGVKILEADGETFRSIYDIFVDLSKVYKDMSDTDQSALLELIAGKHRASGISATLNNMTEAQEIYQRSLNSAGSAQEEYDKYLQGSEASLNKFRASMIETYQSVINGDTTKGILDTGNAALQFANSLGLVESTLKGFVAIGAVKGIVSLYSAFKASALQASNFGKALKMASNVPDGNLSKKFSTLKNIATASKSLTDAQLKQVISSKALNNEDRIRILRLTGMEKSLAEAKIAEYGLTQATNAQSTAQKAATINTFSFSAAVKGLSLNLKMAFLNNPIGISIMALSTIIGAVSSKVSEYNEKVRETRQANIDAATSAKEKADELSKLYSQYEQLNSITNKTESQEEQFKQAVIDITKALADKASTLEGLTAGTDDYTEALKNATKAELESQYATAKIGAKAAEEELQSTAYSGWSGSKITIQQNEQMTGVEEHMAALNKVKDILKEYEDLGTYGIEWEPINWDENQNDMKAVVEYYQALIQARDKLVTADNADFLMSSDIYKDINTTINELSDSVEKYTEQQYQALKLEYEWQNGIPTTEEEFKKMETSILNASGAGKEFQSILKGYLNEDFATISESTNSINDMADAVDNATQSISNIKSFSDAWEELKVSTDDSTKKLADNLTELAQAGRLTSEALLEADSSKYFENLGISADDAVQKINDLVSASTQLNALSDQISKMSDMLADKKNKKTASAADLAGFDVEVRGLDSWKEFEAVMGDSTSSIEDCQKAANALATEWVNNGNFLANLTEQNKQYYITQLDNMGIENAEAIVEATLTQKINEEALATEYATIATSYNSSEKGRNNQITTDLINITGGEIQQLLNEGKVSVDTANNLANLVVQKKIASGTTLNTAADIKNLADLAGASTKLGKLLNQLAAIKQGFTNGMPSEAAAAQAESLQSQIEALVGGGSNTAVVDVPVEIKPTGSSTYKAPSSGSKQKDTKQTVDWISRLLDVLQKKIDATKAKFDNLFTLKDKKNNLAKQLSLTKNLLTATEKSADRYKKAANKVKLSDDLKKKVRNGSYDINEYDSDTADAINKYKDYYDQYLSLLQQEETLKKDIRDIEIQGYQLDADNAEAKIAKSQALAAPDEGNYKKQNKHLKAQKKYLREQYDAQIKIAEAEGNTLEVERLRAELLKELRDNTKEQFDNIANTYDNKIGLTNNKIQAFQDQISLLEAKGQQIGSALYTKQMSLNNANEKKLVAEREKLIAKLEEIPKNTEEWYDAVDTLFAVDSELTQIQIDNANLQKSINQLKFDRFDDLLDKLNAIVNETNFLIDMLDSDKLYDDNGNITDDGLTAMGLNAQNYNVYLQKAQKYKEQIRQLEQMYASGDVDSETYESKMLEYQQGQRDMISSANDCKAAIIDLVKQGIELQNKSLEDAISKQKELLNIQKESRDFSRKMLDLDKEIARTERQLAVLNSGADDSEENRKKVRELKSKLEDLKQDRDDTLYDKSIEQQQDALSTMLDDAKSATEIYLKDTDRVFIDSLNLVNTNTEQVSKNLEKISEDLGYSISENITDAWKDGGKAVDTYANILQGSVPKINLQIESITTKWNEACKAAEKAAQAIVNATEGKYTDYTTNGADSKVLTDVEWYISKNGKTPKNNPSSYSLLNQYIYKKTGKVIDEDKMAGLAKILGVKGVGKDTTADDRSKILKALKDAKFSSGGVINAKSLIRQTGEDGIALVKHEEAVLTKPEWQSIRDLGIALTNLNQQIYKPYIPEFQARNVQPISNNININTTVEGVATDKIVKDFENVATKSVEKAFSKVNNISYTSKNISRR